MYSSKLVGILATKHCFHLYFGACNLDKIYIKTDCQFDPFICSTQRTWMSVYMT